MCQDPREMAGYWRGGQGFELLEHAGMLLLCQEVKHSLLVRSSRKLLAYPSIRLKGIFFLARNFSFGLIVLINSIRVSSLLCL